MFDLERDGTPPVDLAGGLTVTGAVAALIRAVADLAATRSIEHCDEELLAETAALEQARRFLDSAESDRLAELDRRGTTEEVCGQRTTSWLAHQAKLPRSVAASRVAAARKLAGPLADVGDALAAGTIGFDHARTISDAANPRNVDELSSVAAELCDVAGLTTFERWKTEVRGLADQLDADGGHDPAGDAAAARLSANRVGGVTVLNGQLVGDGALISESALQQVADELFRQYGKDANLSADVVIPKRPQLLAEAFVEICRRALAVDLRASRPPRVEATVVLNAAEPEHVTDCSGIELPGVGTLLCDAALVPLVTTFTGLPLAMGRTKRLATAAQIRAINHRDGGCTHPGCPSPAAWNDMHHIDEWGSDGHSDVDRMCGLCRFHHGVAHRDDWSVELTPDGWTLWRAPSGHTYWGQRHQRQRDCPLPDADRAPPAAAGSARTARRIADQRTSRPQTSRDPT